MSQFSLHRVRDRDEWVCRIQSTLGTETAYLLCAPVVRRSDWTSPIPALHILVVVKGEDHLVLMSQMIALPSVALGPAVGSADIAREEILRAVELLVFGF